MEPVWDVSSAGPGRTRGEDSEELMNPRGIIPSDQAVGMSRAPEDPPDRWRLRSPGDQEAGLTTAHKFKLFPMCVILQVVVVAAVAADAFLLLLLRSKRDESSGSWSSRRRERRARRRRLRWSINPAVIGWGCMWSGNAVMNAILCAALLLVAEPSPSSSSGSQVLSHANLPDSPVHLCLPNWTV